MMDSSIFGCRMWCQINWHLSDSIFLAICSCKMFKLKNLCCGFQWFSAIQRCHISRSRVLGFFGRSFPATGTTKTRGDLLTSRGLDWPHMLWSRTRMTRTDGTDGPTDQKKNHGKIYVFCAKRSRIVLWCEVAKTFWICKKNPSYLVNFF